VTLSNFQDHFSCKQSFQRYRCTHHSNLFGHTKGDSNQKRPS